MRHYQYMEEISIGIDINLIFSWIISVGNLKIIISLYYVAGNIASLKTASLYYKQPIK